MFIHYSLVFAFLFTCSLFVMENSINTFHHSLVPNEINTDVQIIYSTNNLQIHYDILFAPLTRFLRYSLYCDVL